MTWWKKWRRRRKFLKAARILTAEAQRHIDHDHNMQFTAVSESYVLMICRGCSDNQP